MPMFISELPNHRCPSGKIDGSRRKKTPFKLVPSIFNQTNLPPPQKKKNMTPRDTSARRPRLSPCWPPLVRSWPWSSRRLGRMGRMGRMGVFCWQTPVKNGKPNKVNTGEGEPRTMCRIKNSAAISGWDRPLLTFIYPGFDCGSHANSQATSC